MSKKIFIVQGPDGIVEAFTTVKHAYNFAAHYVDYACRISFEDVKTALKYGDFIKVGEQAGFDGEAWTITWVELNKYNYLFDKMYQK